MKQQIIIGKIVAPHGVRGDVRVVPLTDFPERFRAMERVILDDGAVLAIESVKYHNQYINIKFKGVQTRDEAGLLRGRLLKVPRDEAVPLSPGEYYIFDIVGLKVYTEEGAYLGTVGNVLRTGGNDVYVVDGEDGKSTLVPALKKVVTFMDVPGGRMTVRLQEEWE